MNKRVQTLLRILLAAAGVIGTGICAVQFAVAVRFMELGRVLFYFFLASLCVETAVFSVVQLVKNRKK